MIRVKCLACASLRALQKIQKETYLLNTRTNFEVFPVFDQCVETNFRETCSRDELFFFRDFLC